MKAMQTEAAFPHRASATVTAAAMPVTIMTVVTANGATTIVNTFARPICIALACVALCSSLLSLTACSLLSKTETSATSKAEATADESPASPDRSTPAEPPLSLITAQTPAIKAWRKIGAAHIYKAYPKRIYKGKIPPLVYAVVVVETHVAADGKVTDVTFSRVPGHAPEVPPKIAALVREASPLPSPGRLGEHIYVDTWLWDKGGNFQLDTLTQGQRSR